MTGALKKDVKTAYTPGTPGVPGTPGSPAIPAQPAHMEWRPRRVSYDGPPRYIYSYMVGGFRVFVDQFDVWRAYGLARFERVESPLQILSDMVGRNLKASEAHYTEVRRGLYIVSWTPPWIDILERVEVPATAGTPAVPPTPGVPTTPATTAKDFNIGWNSGARSVAASASDCAYTFSVDPSAVGIVTGLNDADNNTGYGEIDFGLYLGLGRAQVYEGGLSRSAAVDFGVGDTFTIQRQGHVVTYAHNGTVFYTSSTPSTGTVFADTSMYMGGDTITAASFGELTLPTPGAHGTGEFLPLTGGGGDKAYVGGAGRLLPLAGAGYGPPPAGYVTPPGGEAHPESPDGGYVPPSMYGSGRFLPLAGGGGVAHASGVGALAPLTGHGFIGSLAPAYAVGSGALSYLTGAGTGLTGGVGTCDGSFLPLSGKGSDHAIWEGAGTFEPLTGFGGSATTWSWSAQADLAMPGPFTVQARGTQHAPNTLKARMPRFGVQAFGGGSLKASLPMPTVVATGVGVVVGRVNASLPMPTVAAAGMSGAVGQIDAALQGGFTVEAFSGGVIEAVLHGGFTLQASGVAGSTGRLTATMPMFELVAHASTDRVGRIDATMPMIRPVPSAAFNALMPMFRVVASGHAVVAVEYEAYTMNLVGPVDLDPRSPHAPSGREITRYTHFPFDQIVRHGDKYYGVSSTGLYLLGGDTDDGAPIPWAFRTATTDFGTIQRKTVVSAYLGGKVMPTATAKIFAGEQGEINYTYPVPPSATNQNYRVRFGRGLKTRYFALEMSDAQGGDVRADSIDFEINTMTRAL